MKLEGVYSVLPTPFTAGGELDPESLERVTVLETVVRHVDGRVRVVAGATADGLRTCIDYTKFAKDTGADAVMISPPRSPKLNSESVVRHFAAVAGAVEIPIVIQDYPPISG